MIFPRVALQVPAIHHARVEGFPENLRDGDPRLGLSHPADRLVDDDARGLVAGGARGCVERGGGAGGAEGGSVPLVPADGEFLAWSAVVQGNILFLPRNWSSLFPSF